MLLSGTLMNSLRPSVVLRMQKRLSRLAADWGLAVWFENVQDLSTYILTDFPESLFYAEITLRSHFPGRVFDIAPGDGLAALADGEIVLPCPISLDLRGLSADLLSIPGQCRR